MHVVPPYVNNCINKFSQPWMSIISTTEQFLTRIIEDIYFFDTADDTIKNDFSDMFVSGTPLHVAVDK